MERIIQTIESNKLEEVLDFVEEVFTDSESREDALIVRNLVKEIRSKKYYLPELELIMVNEFDEIIGYCMFSRFHLEGKYDDELLILSPVAVKTKYQRQHISKEMIEYGLDKAKELGYKACLVEGNPQNYRSRGFKTSAEYGIFASESIHLPAVECLMVTELIPNGLDRIKGYVSYDMYESLS